VSKINADLENEGYVGNLYLNERGLDFLWFLLRLHDVCIENPWRSVPYIKG